MSYFVFFVVSVRRGFLFLLVLGMGYVILLWNSLSLPYNYYFFKYLYCISYGGLGCAHKTSLSPQ